MKNSDSGIPIVSLSKQKIEDLFARPLPKDTPIIPDGFVSDIMKRRAKFYNQPRLMDRILDDIRKEKSQNET